MSAIGLGAAVTASAVSAVASTAISKGIGDLFSNDFNPEYKKENLMRMRYVQQKYAMAYGAGVIGEDYDSIIKKLDPQSRLLLDANRPVNPFYSEKAFEDSLVLNYYPVPGHQGRFSASHGIATIAVIIDYQNTRRRRAYIPMVSGPGKPNDYINLFLEESKMWFRNYMSLENVSSEEMLKRSLYYERLKYDNYYWCFPPEGLMSDSTSNTDSGDTNQGIHHVIRFMHEKVKHAYEVLVLEEKNKSLLSLFKDLNNNCVNTLEFGKCFLGYLLCHSTKLGYNIFNADSGYFSSSGGYNTKKAYECGKLHRLLVKVTESLHKDYLFEPSNQNQGSFVSSSPSSSTAASMEVVVRSLNSGGVGSGIGMGSKSLASTGMGSYIIDVTTDEDDSGFNLFSSSIAFVLEVCNPKGILWAVRKTYDDFETLQKTLIEDCNIRDKIGDLMYDRFLYYPDLYVSESNNSSSTNITNSSNSSNSNISSSKSSSSIGRGGLFRKRVDIDKACELLKDYVLRLLLHLRFFSEKIVSVICDFLDVKTLVFVTDDVLAVSMGNYRGQSAGSVGCHEAMRGTIAESLPNIFVQLKEEFQNQLLIGTNKGKGGMASGGGGGVGDVSIAGAVGDSENRANNSKRTEMSKDMLELRKNWGIEMSLLIFNSYSLLQRFSVVISWTLEISHYFISMFGNTFSFSKFPLKNILNLLKEIVNTFLANANELFAFACKINADNAYKWHCNLQIAENNLTRVKHHIEVCLSLISTIESEHLNHEAQIKRLNSVLLRFKPFLSRIETNLQSIQKELNFNIALPDSFFNDDSFKDDGSNNNSIDNYNNNHNNNNARIEFLADSKELADYDTTGNRISDRFLLLTSNVSSSSSNDVKGGDAKGEGEGGRARSEMLAVGGLGDEGGQSQVCTLS